MNETLQLVIDWVNGGASLAVAGAVLALAGLVRVVLVPLAVKVLERLNVVPDGNGKRFLVYVVSFLLVAFINWVHPPVPPLAWAELFGVAAAIAAAAVGVHQVTKGNPEAGGI